MMAERVAVSTRCILAEANDVCFGSILNDEVYAELITPLVGVITPLVGVLLARSKLPRWQAII